MKVENKAFNEAFGRNLEKVMLEHGLTAQDVAANANIEPKQVYRVINAEHSPSLNIIIAIAKGLNIHPRDLFDFDY